MYYYLNKYSTGIFDLQSLLNGLLALYYFWYRRKELEYKFIDRCGLFPYYNALNKIRITLHFVILFYSRRNPQH
jgi:hypothetical protein